MAIYQFYLAVFPKKGVLEYFGEIPKQLKVDFKKRTEDFKKNKINDEPDYLEKLMHQCWKLVKQKPDNIISLIDDELDRANWENDKTSNNWKTETNKIDNDAWLSTNEEFNQIKEFSFRADLRDSNLNFLRKMIEIAQTYDLLLMDWNGNLVNPKIEEVMQLIQESNSFKFVENPIKFLDDLEKGKTEIE